jgi:hypothetical protein
VAAGHPAEAGWVEKHGLRAANREANMARGELHRAELERLVRAGCSIAEIATEHGLRASRADHVTPRSRLDL